MRAARFVVPALVLGALAGTGGVLAATPVATIATVAGTGTAGYSGDGGPATAAELNHPRGLAIAPGGGFAIADAFGETVRRVLPDGTIETVAGTGTAGYSGDGGPGAAAELNLPHGVAFLPDGTLLIADTLNNRIRAVSPGGTITTVAGTGAYAYSGDGGPAAAAAIESPRGISAVPGGGYLIPDTDNQRIRRVTPDGTITTVAGNGARGFGGDGGPATSAPLDEPFGAVATADGGLLIADTGNNRIRRVAPDGTITTVAGNGVRGFSGDGGPATAAELNAPHAVAGLPDGGFLVADEANNRVRRVWPDGTITTIVGTGDAAFGGDGGAASAAAIDGPKAFAVLPNYLGFLLADAYNSRVRLVSVDLRRVLTLRLATRTLRIKAKRKATLAYTVSDPVTVRLDVLRAGRIVVHFTASAKAGRNAFRFGSGLRPGTYTLRLRASAAIDTPATATATLRVSA
jgi:NHL repeat-containing protein